MFYKIRALPYLCSFCPPLVRERSNYHPRSVNDFSLPFARTVLSYKRSFASAAHSLGDSLVLASDI